LPASGLSSLADGGDVDEFIAALDQALKAIDRMGEAPRQDLELELYRRVSQFESEVPRRCVKWWYNEDGSPRADNIEELWNRS
jgi:hypothetical protein